MKLLNTLFTNSDLSSGSFFPILMRIGLSEYLNPYRLCHRDTTALYNNKILQLKVDTLEEVMFHCQESGFHPRKIALVKEFFTALISLSEFIQAHTSGENLSSFAEIIKVIQQFDGDHNIDDSQNATQLFKLNQYIDRLDQKIIKGLTPGNNVEKYDALAACLNDYFDGKNSTALSEICNALKATVMPAYQLINGKKIPAYPLSANSLYKKHRIQNATEILKLERASIPFR